MRTYFPHHRSNKWLNHLTISFSCFQFFSTVFELFFFGFSFSCNISRVSDKKIRLSCFLDNMVNWVYLKLSRLLSHWADRRLAGPDDSSYVFTTKYASLDLYLLFSKKKIGKYFGKNNENRLYSSRSRHLLFLK